MYGDDVLTLENIGERSARRLSDFWESKPRSMPKRCCVHPDDARRLYIQIMALGLRNTGRPHRGSKRMEICGCKVLCTPRATPGFLFFE